MSVACGPAKLLPNDSKTVTTTAEFPNTTDINDVTLANITQSDRNKEESLQSDHYGKSVIS